jgi:hypothetical protein
MTDPRRAFVLETLTHSLAPAADQVGSSHAARPLPKPYGDRSLRSRSRSL